jgi:hypothetical protein
MMFGSLRKLTEFPDRDQMLKVLIVRIDEIDREVIMYQKLAYENE